MKIERETEQTGGDSNISAIQVYRYTTEALRTLSLPAREEGGCTIMPKTYLRSAEDPDFDWDMDTVLEVIESLRSPSISPSVEENLANLFGKILVGLRRGERLIIEEEPVT